jgi:hypothetical protein
VKVFEFTPTAQPVQPPQFALAGEEFTCISGDQLSSLDVLDYIAGMSGESGLVRIQTMVRLFREFIPAADMDRFRKTITTNRVPLTTLSDIASWTLDEYLNFPTQAAEQSSSPGSSAAESPSVDDSSVPQDVISPT